MLLAPFAKLAHNQAAGVELLIFSGMVVGAVANRAFHHDQIVLRHIFLYYYLNEALLQN
jgi:hypothetical protein